MSHPYAKMTGEQRKALDSEGYLVLRGALDAGWIARLRLAFDAAAQPRGTQHVRIGPDTPQRDAWEKVARLPVLIDAATHVLGVLRLRDYHGRNPLMGYGQQGLHADAGERLTGVPFEVVSAVVMLDDFGAHNGATRVVPATHVLPGTIPRALAQPLAHHPAERLVVGAAGDVLVFNGHLWHSGTRNETSHPRRAVQMVFERQKPSDG